MNTTDELKQLQSEISNEYNAEKFRKNAHELVDILADFLDQSVNNKTDKMISNKAPDVMFEKYKSDFSEKSNYEFSELVEGLLVDVTRLQHPHYLGHQVSAPLPVSAMSEFVATLLNNSTCVYEMGSSACAIEKTVTDWMAQKIGFDENGGGFLTSGGTIGNLTSLLCARQNVLDYNVWKKGIQKQNCKFLISSACHYSIKRAVCIMGFGEDSAVMIPTNSDYTMNYEELEKAYNEAILENNIIVAVVANACSTATGSYDDLEKIGDFCEKHNLWFHVDGAHGAPALLSDLYKYRLKGIEKADSVVWDTHKMMMLSSLATGVIFKDNKNAHKTFTQNASYILDRVSQTNWYDFGLQTMECTKPFMSLRIYMALKILGEKFFGNYINYVYKLTEKFARHLEKSDDFELPVFPQSNIVCFRYTGKKVDNFDDLQNAIRNKLINSEHFYIVKTELNGKLYLRCTIINPNTGFEHLIQLLDEIRKIATNI